jgi:hypothetical protein
MGFYTRSFEKLKKIKIKIISSDGFLRKSSVGIMDFYRQFFNKPHINL